MSPLIGPPVYLYLTDVKTGRGAVIAVFALTLGACASSAAHIGTANDILAGLPVKGRAPMTGYARRQFGPAWADADHNGCDTRNDILNRDLMHKQWRPGTHNCVVIAGVLADPYSGATIPFRKAAASV